MQYLDTMYLTYANNDFVTFGVTEDNYRTFFGLPVASNHTYYQMLYSYAIELQYSSSAQYMVRDKNGYLTKEWLDAVGFLGKIDGISRNNRVQNAQVNEAVKRYNLSKEGRIKLHDEISKVGYGFDEILEIAEDIAKQGGKYVNK